MKTETRYITKENITTTVFTHNLDNIINTHIFSVFIKTPCIPQYLMQNNSKVHCICQIALKFFTDMHSV